MLVLFLCLFPLVFANKVQQVHLSYFGNPNEMTVTWLTQHPLDAKTPPYVIYGTDSKKLSYTVPASAKEWTDVSGKTRYTYRAILSGLTPGKRYYYSTGSDDLMSDVYNFRAMDPTRQLRAAVFADFGLKKGYSLDALINATQSDAFDIVFHIGDISYDLDKNSGDTGDDFMNEIVPIAAYVPYHVVAGNHEQSQDFLHYKERFSMPPNGILTDNQFWSIDIGNTHIIGISTEYYGFAMPEQAQLQYNWLVNDLKQNHGKWTIVLMHRPMYCSNDDVAGCQGAENLMTRNGQPGLPALEPLFNSAGVDLVFWGHQHSYERNWPVYENKAYPQPTLNHYHNASTPVYIMSGSAGCHDHEDVSQKIQQPYTATMFGEYGYSVLTVVSDSQITTQFININDTTNPLDNFYLTKDAPFKPGMLKSKLKL